MHHLGALELTLLLVMAIVLFGSKRIIELTQDLADAITHFRNGGPGSPSHPIPSNDSKLLNRRRNRAS
jgi:Sec-independent protein translocase protein TatA